MGRSRENGGGHIGQSKLHAPLECDGFWRLDCLLSGPGRAAGYVPTLAVAVSDAPSAPFLSCRILLRSVLKLYIFPPTAPQQLFLHQASVSFIFGLVLKEMEEEKKAQEAIICGSVRKQIKNWNT